MYRPSVESGVQECASSCQGDLKTYMEDSTDRYCVQCQSELTLVSGTDHYKCAPCTSLMYVVQNDLKMCRDSCDGSNLL